MNWKLAEQQQHCRKGRNLLNIVFMIKNPSLIKDWLLIIIGILLVVFAFTDVPEKIDIYLTLIIGILVGIIGIWGLIPKKTQPSPPTF